MNRLIITEEERSRILGMHQSATKKQYLNEDAVTVAPGTISVPYNIDSKTGAQVLATNKYVKVTIINEKTPQNKNGWLTEMGYDSLGQIQFQTPGLSFPLKGIQKDSNGNLTGMFAITPSQKDLINYLTSMNGKNLPNTNSVFIELKGKGAVKSLPMGVTTKFTTYNPSTPATTTPTKTKGLNESDIRRIVRRVIKESNRGYLVEDDFKGGLTLALMNQLNSYLNSLIPKAKAMNVAMNSVFSVVQSGTSPDVNGNPVPKYTINYGSKDIFQGEGFSDVDLQGAMKSDYLNKIYPTRINTKLNANNITAVKSKELSNLAMRFDLANGASNTYKAWVASIGPQQPTKTPTKQPVKKP
jgi:hypothetical protein